MNVRQALLDSGINVFAVDLLAESFLKSVLAQMTTKKGEALQFFLPIERGDCAAYMGVDIALMPVLKGAPEESTKIMRGEPNFPAEPPASAVTQDTADRVTHSSVAQQEKGS